MMHFCARKFNAVILIFTIHQGCVPEVVAVTPSEVVVVVIVVPVRIPPVMVVHTHVVLFDHAQVCVRVGLTGALLTVNVTGITNGLLAKV